MKAQEKAKELVEMFYKNCCLTIAGAGSLWWPLAKKQALICVDEIIASYTNNLQELHIDFIDHNPIDYWQQVKEEIEKL